MPTAPSLDIIRFGTDRPAAESKILKAGPLTAELDAGNLRYIRYAGHEAIRAISYVVRDQYWGTFNPEFGDIVIETTSDSFRVSYAATCSDGAQSFSYDARITGRADGSLEFAANGRAAGDFLTNRTGFVVLHPIAGVAGEPAQVVEVDGKQVETRFPAEIDPKQPIMNIRSIRHQVTDGLAVICTMNGDTFEMEDQRNWTDASYKTYVRPLGLPHPFTLKAGEEIEQSVALSFSGTPRIAIEPGQQEAVTVSLGAISGTMPTFGMMIEADQADTALQHADYLTRLLPNYLSCYLDPRRHDIPQTLTNFSQIGEVCGTPLALEVVVPDDAPATGTLSSLAAAVADAGIHLQSLAVSPAGDLNFVIPGTEFPDTREFDELYAAARSAFPGIPLGGGNFVYFTELNRKRPPHAQLDFICHGTSALVHAADDRSVTETIECLPSIIASARALFGPIPYRIGPVGIGSRTSPFGNEPTPNTDADRVTMTRADPRQRGLLGAAWHLGYAARLAAGGVDRATMGALTGEFGLIHTAASYRQPWYDDHEGALFPAFHILRALYSTAQCPSIHAESDRPGEVQAVAWGTDAGYEIWLANLSGTAQTIQLRGVSESSGQLWMLDENTFASAARDPDAQNNGHFHKISAPITLSAYGVARVTV